METTTIKEYSCGRQGSSVVWMAVLMVWFALPMCLLSWISSMVSLITNWTDGKPPTGKDFLISLGLMIGAWMAAGTSSLINEYNTIRVTDKGLEVRVFSMIFYWKTVPWEEISGVEAISIVGCGLPVWVIKIKRLTYWHAMLSKQYRVASRAIIVLTPYLKKREELVEIIKARTTMKANC